MSKDLLRNPTSRTPAILQKSGFAGKQDAIAGRRPGIRSVLTAATAEQLVAIRSAEPGEQVLLAGWGANRWTNDQTKELKNDMEYTHISFRVLLIERIFILNARHN